jgi:lipid-A-disaccharide synthase
VRIKTIALVNIVAGRTVVPELIQHEATPAKIAAVIEGYLTDSQHYASVRKELSAVMLKLGEAGASVKVADAIMAA